jgi:hypothetical protein
MGKSSPAPIDYEAAALAEGEYAKDVTAQQTWANRPIQNNPWGSITWGQDQVIDPGTGKPVTQWTQNTQLAQPLNEALWAQMNMQNSRSQLGAGMMGALKNQYFTEGDDGQMYYNAPDWEGAGGMMTPDAPQYLSLQDMPDMWGHLQWDIPSYETTGQLRQLDYSGLPGVDSPEFTLDRAENATYNRMAGRLEEQFGGEQQALDIKLRNQGLVPGDEAYEAQMRNFNQRKTDAFQTAQNEAIMAGGREAERMFGMQSQRRGQYGGELMDLGNFANQAAMNDFQQRMAAGQAGWDATRQAAQFQNQARQQSLQERMGAMGFNNQQQYQYADYYNKMRQQQINEYMTQRGFTLNEIQALLNNQQVGLPQFNQFTQATKSDTAPILQGAQMQGEWNTAQANADNAFMNNLMGGAANIAGMAGMFSDRRLKSNIRRIGERNGVNWYSYEIFGRPQIGVMADEVPWAAVQHPSGYLMVDYSKV